MTGSEERDPDSLQWCPVMTRGTGHKLKCAGPSEDTNPPFTVGVARFRTGFPEKLSPAVMILKTHIAMVLVCLFQVILLKHEWTRWSRGPFQPKLFREKKTKQTPTEKERQFTVRQGGWNPNLLSCLCDPLWQQTLLQTLKLIHLC